MSRTLATMAILKENWNADRDYLSNFEPFVTESLRRLPPGEVVQAPAVAKALLSEFDLHMPQGVIETLLKRALRSGILEKAPNARERFVVPEELDKMPDLLQARGDAARDVRALLDALRAHAQQAGVEWTEDQAEQALMRFLDDSGTQFATARRRGRADELWISANQAKAVVHSFARHAVERDPEGLRLLEQAVKGSMLSNVLYFDKLGEFSPSMKNIAVYIDTPIVLRLLGVSTRQQIDASQELLKILKTALIPIKIFATPSPRSKESSRARPLTSASRGRRSPAAPCISRVPPCSPPKRIVDDMSPPVARLTQPSPTCTTLGNQRVATRSDLRAHGQPALPARA